LSRFSLFRGKWGRRLVLSEMIVILGASFVATWLAVGGSKADHYIEALQALVQLDSFIVAGWTAGFFYFWNSTATEFRALEKELHALRRELDANRDDAEEFAKAVKNLASIESMTKNLTDNLFVAGISALGNFVASGVWAIVGIVANDGSDLLVSSVFMLLGVGLMLNSWSLIHDSTSLLSKLKSELSIIRVKA